MAREDRSDNKQRCESYTSQMTFHSRLPLLGHRQSDAFGYGTRLSYFLDAFPDCLPDAGSQPGLQGTFTSTRFWFAD
jgi:hypothetical protein